MILFIGRKHECPIVNGHFISWIKSVFIYNVLGWLCASPAVACLGTLALLDEATFANETLEEGGDATAGEGELESIGDVFVRDGFFLGKEGGKTLFHFFVLDIESHSVGHLVHFETSCLLQQLAVWLKEDVADAHVAAVVEIHIVAAFDGDVALQGETEGADAGQTDGVALLHLMQHHTPQRVQRTQQLALWLQGRQAEGTVLKLHGIHRASFLYLWPQAFQPLVIGGYVLLLVGQQSTFGNGKSYRHNRCL